MTEDLYPTATRDLARLRRSLAPDAATAFHDFGAAVFAEGALSTRTKHLIAVAAAHVTQCPYCIRGHTRAALHHGNSREEVMEAIWVAAEMRAGAAYAHSVIALAEMNELEAAPADERREAALNGEEQHAQ